MKKINIFNLFLFLLLAGQFSCGKDFLDVKPSNATDADKSIQTAGDAQVIISGIMRKMTDENYYGRNFIMYGDAKGGDLTVFSQGRGLDNLYTFNHSANSGNYGTFWSTLYNIILQANSLLDGIEKLEAAGSAEDFSSSKGQALTIRALVYFDLVRLYGKTYTEDPSALGVPNVTTPLDPYAQPLRNTVEENYTQILSDLKQAEPLLSRETANGYVNYYANKAIQTRVYLTMGNPQAALAAAEEIINSNVYTLYTPSQWVNSWKEKFASESIFELGIVANEGDLGAASLGAYLRRKAHGGGSIAGWFGASDYFLNRLGQDARDVRWGTMDDDELSTEAKPRLGACYKYSGGADWVDDEKISNTTAMNIKVIRLSEVYLIAAEAVLPTNKTRAAAYLNAIRRRAPNLAPATAATVTLNMIMDEKSKELFAEGQRYFDMIRLNRPITFNDEYIGAIVTHRDKTINRDFYKTILPISQDELNANPGLKAQQNPEY